MKKAKVLVCESNFLYREGLKTVIDRNPFYEAIHEALNSEDLENKLLNNKYDLVTIDFADEPAFGIDTITLIQEQNPEAKILIISNESNKRNIYNVLSRGINNYVTKSCSGQEIYKALEASLKDQKYFCNTILDIIIDKSFGEDEDDTTTTADILTSREKEIVQLIAQGKMAKEISSILNISVHTIYTHRKNIMKKLKISSPVELITYAINSGIVKV